MTRLVTQQNLRWFPNNKKQNNHKHTNDFHTALVFQCLLLLHIILREQILNAFHVRHRLGLQGTKGFLAGEFTQVQESL